jgi:hypothetical protein
MAPAPRVARLGGGVRHPALLEGDALDDLIGRYWQMLPLPEGDLPDNAPRRGIWLSRLQPERQEELGVNLRMVWL